MRIVITICLLFISVYDIWAGQSRSVYLGETEMAQVQINPGRSTILSFPVRPTKVILGNQGSFTVEFVENDLAIAALKTPATGNLFVYMEGRRFAFDLQTVALKGDEIILVRDATERKPVKSPRGKRD